MADPTIATVVFPARDLGAGIRAWSTVFGGGPLFATDDFAVFRSADTEIGLTALPWVDQPLVFLDAEDVEATREQLVAAGATGMGEIADGSLAELGTAEITNGDPRTGIVEIPGSRLAVVRLADGSLLGLRQSVPFGG
jgi:hypothetical protein